jgi:hypothetical protein
MPEFDWSRIQNQLKKRRRRKKKRKGKKILVGAKKIFSSKCLIGCMLQSFLTAAAATPPATNFYLQKLGSDFMWNIKVLFLLSQ